MKRYSVEASTFEEDGTESQKVLHTSNSINLSRAYFAGFTTASDWKDYDIISLIDTAQPSDGALFLIDSRMHPSIDTGATSQSLSDFTEVWTDVTLWGGRL